MAERSAVVEVRAQRASRPRVRILGIGMGPQHVTREVAEALRDADYVLAAEKAEDDQLLAVRRRIAADAGVPVVAVPDPRRDRADVDAMGDYRRAVGDWHDARVAAYEAVLAERGGTAAMLVWGDASLYDSSIRIVSAIASRGVVDLEWDVLPGISAPQLLAARHRLVLNDVGRPVHVTTGRRLQEEIAAGLDNVVVMLNRHLDLAGCEDWDIWWGANLGGVGEELVAGRVGDVLPAIEAARERAKAAAGWLMDLYLVRRPS
ncbi:precorrin-6A synthase (deacetylating) [Nocardioides sp. CER19]|uniref:precorrin-6A synthase (deacetylating) n=1 Tax=Nocardioides sp. CER19 TaxID=3038538 RepID=UPI002447DEA5|nr:precorrin-6A synthase (deacetylating) [Nocardioides sp. CER19]MDH2416022.1 precorrin-6A synthase (deacetylating) [Nocardioides sp. CER19]